MVIGGDISGRMTERWDDLISRVLLSFKGKISTDILLRTLVESILSRTSSHLRVIYEQFIYLETGVSQSPEYLLCVSVLYNYGMRS